MGQEWDAEYKMNSPVSVRVEANKILIDRLNKVVNQSKINYGKRFR